MKIKKNKKDEFFFKINAMNNNCETNKWKKQTRDIINKESERDGRTTLGCLFRGKN